MLKTPFRTLFHSEEYHGWKKSRNFFEGWYYKIVSKSENEAIAIIPGIAMDQNGHQQAFIQVLDGKRLTSEYFKFSPTEFVPEAGKFQLHIGSNYFSIDELSLELPNINGKLLFSKQVPWSNQWYSPGIMGPFSFVPFMECYHGILSMNSEIDGELMITGNTIDFSGGKGYMEKDWGHSFPSAYIWIQSNHFGQSNVSLKASVAKIPWLGSSFIGFIAGVWIHDQLIEFTTYNFTKLEKSTASLDIVEIVMQNRNHRLEIKAKRTEATVLASPILGFMAGRIEESMTSELDVRLTDIKKGTVLLNDTGRNCGLEVAGNIKEITIPNR